MKKKGLPATGILIHEARKNGFNSVFEYLMHLKETGKLAEIKKEAMSDEDDDDVPKKKKKKIKREPRVETSDEEDTPSRNLRRRKVQIKKEPIPEEERIRIKEEIGLYPNKSRNTERKEPRVNKRKKAVRRKIIKKIKTEEGIIVKKEENVIDQDFQDNDVEEEGEYEVEAVLDVKALYVCSDFLYRLTNHIREKYIIS